MAKQLCRMYGQTWRAASLSGGKRWTDVAVARESGVDDDRCVS